MADIFISYAREDREIARRLAEALEQEELTVWWDSKILGGRSFRQAIHDEIDAAACVIVIWSTHSSVSRFVVDEAEEALAKQKPLVPVTVDGSSGAIGFRGYQVVDLSRWHEGGDGQGFRRLIESIRLAMGEPVETEDLPVIMPGQDDDIPPVKSSTTEASGEADFRPPVEGKPADDDSRTPRKSRAYLWLLLVLLVAGAGFGGYQYYRSVVEAEFQAKVRASELRTRLYEARDEQDGIEAEIRNLEAAIDKAKKAADAAHRAEQQASDRFSRNNAIIDQLGEKVRGVTRTADIRILKTQIQKAEKDQADLKKRISDQAGIKRQESQRAKDIDLKLQDALARKNAVQREINSLLKQLRELGV